MTTAFLGTTVSGEDTRRLCPNFWEVFRFFLQIISWVKDSNTKEDHPEMINVPLKIQGRWHSNLANAALARKSN